MGFGFGSYPSLLTVVLAMVSSSALILTVQSATHPSDIQALKDLVKGLDPETVLQGSCLSSWDFSVDPCDSLFGQQFTCGFRCDFNDSSGLARVTEISLDRAGYSGPLSLSPNLAFLQTLDVAENRFNGSIPPSVFNLSRLSRLSLSRNFFSGGIPDSISSPALSNLQELFLDGNLLQGQIPAGIGDSGGLQSLQRLELQENRLSGEFPDLSRLKNLTFLDASNNSLSGVLDFGRFPESIVQISMRNNGLEREISNSNRIWDLGFLQVLDLTYNRLSGALPAALFQHPALQQLTLSYNRFSEIQIPWNSGVGSELIALDLAHNQLEGTLPTFFGLMPKLSALSLEKNRFTGMIPVQYALKVVQTGGIAPFARLLLSGNYLYGPIPSLFMAMKPGSAMVSLVDNCLLRCPEDFFFCQGGAQKPYDTCKSFSPVIP